MVDLMLKEGTTVLTIQGKVSGEVIEKVTTNFSLSDKQGWFFVDYANAEVPLNYRFDVVLQGIAKQLIAGPGLEPNSFSITLISCLDQFGNSLPGIPQGYKTICKFEFRPEIPPAFLDLPFLPTWKYNPSGLTVATHEDIAVLGDEAIFNDLLTIVHIQLKNEFSRRKRKSIPFTDFYRYFFDILHIPKSRASLILETLQQLGKVNIKNDKELELLEVEK